MIQVQNKTDIHTHTHTRKHTMLMKSLKGKKKKHLKNPATVPEGFVLFF